MTVGRYEKKLPVVVDAAYPQHTLMIFVASGSTTNLFNASACLEASAQRLILGTLDEESFASGDQRTVTLLSPGDVFTMISSGTIAVGGVVETAAAGEAAPVTGAGTQIGTAIEAAVDNDRFLVLYRPVIA